MATNKKKFSSGALNDTRERVSEAMQTDNPNPFSQAKDERNEAEQEIHTKAARKKTDQKDTIGVNVLLPKEVYSKLQAIRMDMDNIPIRSLCLKLIMESMEKYGKS